MKIFCYLHGSGLVLVLNADKRCSFKRHKTVCTELGLGKSDPVRTINAHDLSGRFHLRAEYGIDAGKLDKGKHGLFYGKMGRFFFFCKTHLVQGLPDHDSCGQLGQGNADGFADKGYRPRRPGVHLQNIDVAVFYRILYIDETDDFQFQGQKLCLP